MQRSEVEVLLIDDNPNDMELTLRILRKHQLADNVVTTRSGIEALDMLYGTGSYQNRGGIFPRLILLDIKLPKMNGLQVLERIKSDPERSSTPVVVLTSSTEESDIVASYRLGVNSFVTKPVNFEQFDDVVHTLGKYWLRINTPPKQQE